MNCEPRGSVRLSVLFHVQVLLLPTFAELQCENGHLNTAGKEKDSVKVELEEGKGT